METKRREKTSGPSGGSTTWGAPTGHVRVVGVVTGRHREGGPIGLRDLLQETQSRVHPSRGRGCTVSMMRREERVPPTPVK